jgi:hypothetical protein
VPIEVVREPVGKIVSNNSGTHQNVFVLVQSINIKWKSSTFVLKILEHWNTSKRFGIVFKSFRLFGKVPLLF